MFAATEDLLTGLLVSQSTVKTVKIKITVSKKKFEIENRASYLDITYELI